MLIFDTTLRTKLEAREILSRGFLNDSFCGSEKQLYNVGQKVSGLNLGFHHGVIIECYKDNGFFYYVVEAKATAKSRKVTHKTVRQIDINLI